MKTLTVVCVKTGSAAGSWSPEESKSDGGSLEGESDESDAESEDGLDDGKSEDGLDDGEESEDDGGSEDGSLDGSDDGLSCASFVNATASIIALLVAFNVVMVPLVIADVRS